MKRKLTPLLLAAALMPCGWAAANEFGDPDRGETVFAKCKGCHQIGPDAENRIGPHLNEVFGRRAAGIEGFDYSKSMNRAGNDGLTWEFETLDAYLENPKALVSGTRMSFRGLKKEQDRADILAYLRAYTVSPSDIPEASPTAMPHWTVPSEILAIDGDAEYGQYLSSECTTCHQVDGADDGIPSITHWPAEDFVVALHAYKEQIRPHPVMQMIAGRLSNEEIAALAAYFANPD